jgi:Kef-type K+ transport system membrane component KefB
MNKNKFTEKLKEGVSAKEIEDFVRNHTTEVFSILAVVIAAASSCWSFFLGGPKLAVFFAAVTCIAAILFPVAIERLLKQLYDFTLKQEKSTQLILGAVKLVIALFIPFAIFAIVGLLAGTSYHYYVRHAQIVVENRPFKSKSKKGHSEEEHD